MDGQQQNLFAGEPGACMVAEEDATEYRLVPANYLGEGRKYTVRGFTAAMAMLKKLNSKKFSHVIESY